MITVQDVLNNTNDILGHYTTGGIDPGQKLRQINRSIEYVKRRLGLPSDEKVHQILFSQDQIFIDLPSDFDEAIVLRYNDENYNRPGYEWEYFDYTDILRRTGDQPDFKFGFTSINGTKQLAMVGHNIRRGETLNTCDSVTDFTAEDDASDLTIDEFQVYEGDASLKFDITNSAGVATISLSVSKDFEELFSRHGYLKLWTFLTDNNIDDISVKLLTDDSNYYTIVEDDQDDGTAFTEDEWIKVGFPMDNAIATGSPDMTNITEIKFEFDLGDGFVSAADFRIDQIFTSFPDKMDLVYYSSIKGTDTTGATTKTQLTELSDKLAIGEMFEDYVDAIAKKAAINIWPSLKGDKEFYLDLKTDFNDLMRTLGRVYPRKRLQVNNLRHKLRR
jgi:hypothetical protein